MKKPEFENYEAEERQKRMDALEARIAQTAAGEHFLDRVYEIGRPKPLHEEPEEGE